MADRRGLRSWLATIARQSTRVMFRLRAGDATRQVVARSCLVLAPHPDDELFGAGGTIMAKLAAGTAVTVAIATDGRASAHPAGLSEDDMAELRCGEARRAAAVMGLRDADLRFLGFADGLLSASLPELRAAVVELIAEVSPEEILVVSALDPHPDHRSLNRAAVSASQGGPVVLEYPVWFWARAPRLAAEVSSGSGIRDVLRVWWRLPVVRVRVGEWRDRKRAAFIAYATRAHLGSFFESSFLGRHEYFFPVGR